MKSRDLSEETLEQALTEIGGFGSQGPKMKRLIVTEQGLQFQADRMRRGELTEGELRAVGIQDAIISEVKRRAALT